MEVTMHSNLPAVDADTRKVRTVPLYRLKDLRTPPQQAEESLIYAVYKRRPLWDPAVHFYRNNTVIKILWEEVANETGLSDNQAKGRWKSLRDYYRLELKKIQKAGGEELKKSNWAHFSSMSFLQELLTPKKSGTAEDPQVADESQSSTEEMDQPAGDSEDVYIRDEDARPPCWRPLRADSTSAREQPQGGLNVRSNFGEVYRKVLIDLERRRLDLLERNSLMEQDDDLQYLKSLLPLVKMLPLSRKIGVRLKFQEIVCKEIEEVERSNSKTHIKEETG